MRTFFQSPFIYCILFENFYGPSYDISYSEALSVFYFTAVKHSCKHLRSSLVSIFNLHPSLLQPVTFRAATRLQFLAGKYDDNLCTQLSRTYLLLRADCVVGGRKGGFSCDTCLETDYLLCFF